MKAQYSLKTTILFHQGMAFLAFALPVYFFAFIAVHVFGFEIRLLTYFSATFFCIFLSSIPLNQEATHVSCLFYHRKNTSQFIKDYLQIRSLSLLFILGVCLLGLRLLSYSHFSYFFEHLRFSYAVMISLMVYLLWFISDIGMLDVQDLTKRVNTPGMAVKGFAWTILLAILTSILLVLGLLVSLPLGVFLIFTLFVVGQFLFGRFYKNVLNLKQRIRSLTILIISFALVTISLCVFESYRGNKEFLVSKYFSHQMDKWVKGSKLAPMQEDEIINLTTWITWMKQHSKNNEFYAKGFVILADICPSQTRLDPLTIECDECKGARVSVLTENIKELSDSDRLERLKFLFNTDSEYANLVGLAHAAIVSDIPDDINAKIKSISQDDKSNIQFIARNLLNSKSDLNKYMAIRFVPPKSPCDEDEDKGKRK